MLAEQEGLSDFMDKKLNKNHIFSVEETTVSKYEQISSDYPLQIPKVAVGEPTFVNPNSYKTSTKVLRKIIKEAGIELYGSTQRKWIIMVYDGLLLKFQHY